MDGCVAEFADVVQRFANAYFTVYYMSRVVVANVVPCSLLVVFHVSLTSTMVVARRRRREMALRRGRGHGVHDRQWRRLGDVVATTMLLAPP